MKFSYKTKLCDNKAVQIVHSGPDFGMPVFLFEDVLEELIFYAKKKNAFGLLTGNGYLEPEAGSDDKMDKVDETPSQDAEPLERDEPDYIEITAFKDVYPVENPLDYAGYLRKVRNFRENGTDLLCLGVVCLADTAAEITLESLLLQRSYFDMPYQIYLIVSAKDASLKAYRLDKKLEFVETGIDVVSIRE